MAKNQTSTSEGKKKPSVIKIILYIVGGLVAISIIGSLLSGDDDTSQTTNNDNTSSEVEQQEERKEEEEITYTEVDAKSFSQEYDDNDVTANKKYADTYIKTTGYIDDISSDFTGAVYIIVQPTNDDWFVGTSMQCFVTDENDVNDIKSGDKITIQGKVDDFDVFYVEIKDCEVL